MILEAIVWFAESLLGARKVVQGINNAKLVVGVSAVENLSVLFFCSKKNYSVEATLQFAKRGTFIQEDTLKDLSVSTILGKIAHRAVTLDLIPPQNIDTEKRTEFTNNYLLNLSATESIQFAIEFASNAVNVHNISVKQIPGRAASIICITGGTIWIDMGERAMITTSTESNSPNRKVYSKGAFVDKSAYKWVGTSGCVETVAACQALATEFSRIVQSRKMEKVSIV